MKHYPPFSDRRKLRTFFATLLTYLLLTTQLTPLALAANSRRATNSPGKKDPGFSTNPQPLVVPSLTVTKTDNIPNATPVNPGDTINYTITITNSGTDATNVTLNDTVDSNTTIVGGSVKATPIPFNDTYTVLGNVRIQVPDGADDLLANDVDPDTGTNAGLTIVALGGDNTAPFSGTSAQGGQVTATTGDGSFQYNPAPGFTGADSFTYTVQDSDGNTKVVTVNVTVNGMIWFVNPAAPVGGDGRLTSPFNCYTGTSNGAQTCFSDTAPDDPTDNVFLYTGTHTGGYTLLANERLIGAGASQALETIAGVTVPTHSDALPSTGTTAPVITTSAAATNGINLGTGNIIRGVNVGNTTGAKIAGSNFGNVTIGSTGGPDVALSGTGQALNLNTGTFVATSAFSSVASTSSGTQGINLAGIAGTVTFGSTSISGNTTQGILVGTTTADINFGNTTVSAGTDAISLQNNSSGTRTFGTITTSGNSGVGFLHAVGGGGVSVTGATLITNPGGNGIDIDSSNANITFAATTVNKNSTSNMGVDLTNNATRIITFSSLAVTTGGAFALNTNNSGTVNVTNASGSSLTQSGAGGGAASLTNTTLGLNFTSVSSNGGGNGLLFSGGGGTFTTGSTNLQNNAGIGLSMSSTAVTANFGNTTVNSSAGDAVDLSSNTANITFADLDLTPDSGLRGLDAQNNTGTITSTSGDIAATGGAAVFIDGPAGRTPLAMVLNNVDSTNATAEGVDIREASGSFVVNDAGVATNISNPTGVGIRVQNSSATFNFGNTTVSSSGGTGVVLGSSGNGNSGATSFGVLNISPDSGQRAFLATENTGAISCTSGAVITTNQTAIEVQGTSNASRTPLNMSLTSVNVTGGNVAPNGIFLQNTSTTGSPGGFNVVGSGGACTPATPTCTGGRIQQTTGADGANAATGVRAINADGISLALMRINDHPNFAIRGVTVNGFNLTNVYIHGTNGTNAAGGTEEGSISFDNLTGSATFNGVDVDGGRRENIRVVNNTGTLNRLTIQNSVIRFHSATDGNDAVRAEATSGGAVMNLTVSNSVFRGARGDMIDFTTQAGTTMDVVIRGNNFTNEQASVVSGNTPIIVQGTGTVTYQVACNRIAQLNAAQTTGTAQGHGINIAKSTAGGNFSGTVFNNTIGATGIQNSGAGTAGAGIQILSNGTGTHTALVKNNVIRNYGESGIRVVGNNGNSTTNVTIIGNITTEPHPTFGFAGLFVDAGAFGSDSNIFNVKVGGSGAEQNDFTAGDPFNASDISLNRTLAGGNTVQVNLTRPPSASNDPVVVLQDNNTGTPAVSNSGTITLVNTTPALPAAIDETCSAPSTPAFAPPAQSDSTDTDGSGEEEPPVTKPGRRPGAVSEAKPAPVKVETPKPIAKAVTRELKRDAGMSASYSAKTNWVKNPTTTPVVAQQRDKGGIGKKDTLASPPNVVGDNITWNLGTLPAGQSVTITFSVTVDTPFLGGSQVSNQATVTADGGISVLSDDPDAAGANNPTITLVNAPPDISVRDAKVAEPTSGTANMLFTVVLSTPAGPSGVQVTYQSASGGANPATPGSDYNDVGPTVLTFTAGQRIKTVSVPVLADADNSETNETLLLNLSSPVNANIVDGQATGTITPTSTPGTFLISELRTSGPAGLGDDFVELYNNSDSPLTIAASDASAGYGLFKKGADCDATPILIGTIPNGTVIPARGHYLVVGSQYSLAGYAAGNLTMSSDIESDANVAIFNTADVGNLSSVTALDAVGFGANTGGVCDLLREGTNLPPVSGSATEHSFSRDSCGKGGNPAAFGLCPQLTPVDSNNNNADFLFADTQGTFIVGVPQRLGAPGPENLAAPIDRNSSIAAVLLDQTVSQTVAPNRVRDLTPNPGANATNGTLSLRRRIQNNTGGNVTRLRFRIIDISSFPSPGGGIADVRGITSTNVVVSGVNDSATCLAANGVPTTPCSVTVIGTTLEQPPSQPNGGATNSSMSVGTITLGTPLANGASVNIQFLLGVQQSGSFKFYVNVEALP